MTRTVNARLVLEIEDDQLDPHVQRVKEAHAAWAALGKQFQDVLGGDLNALKGLMASFASEIGKVSSATGKMKIAPLADSVVILEKTLGSLNPKMDSFASALSRLAPDLERVAKASETWAKSMSSMGTALGKLEERLESLVNAQLKTDKHVSGLIEKMTGVNEALKLQAAGLLKVVQQYAGFNKAVDESEKKTEKAKKATQGWWDSLKELERSFIRHSTVIFILQHQIEALLDSFQSAATQADLGVVLGRSLTDFNRLMEETRASTRGMVSDLKIMQSAALMSSFGILENSAKGVDAFVKNMELVQKLAIRTGQSTDYLMDSFARGIARLSPAILDNLGLQIKLKDAYLAYAAGVGKATEELTAQEKKTAVMQEVLRQATVLTEEVDPAATLAGRLEQTRTRVTNFFNDIKIAMLDMLVELTATGEELAATATARLSLFLKEFKEFGRPVSEDAKRSLKDLSKIAEELNVLKDNPWHSKGTPLDDAIRAFSSGMATGKEIELVREQAQRVETLYSLAPQALQKLMDMREKINKELLEWQEATADSNASPFGVGSKRLEGEELAKVRERAKLQSAWWEDAMIPVESYRVQLIEVADQWERLNGMTKQFPKDALQLFPDDKAAQSAYVQGMTDLLDQARKQFKEQATAGNLEALQGFLHDWKEASEREVLANVRVQSAASAEKIKAVRSEIALMDRQVEGMQLLAGHAKGLTDSEVTLSILKKEVNKEQGLYNQMHEELIELNAENGKYTAKQLGEQRDKLALKYRELAALEASVAFEKEFEKALNDTAVLSKDLRTSEAERLAGYKTRNELETDYVNLRVALALATNELAFATGFYYEILARGQALEADLAADQLEEAQRKLDALKADIIENQKRLAAMPKGPSGGGRGDKGDTGGGVSFVSQEGERVNLLSYMFSSVNSDGELVLSETKQEVRQLLDSLGQVISEEVKTTGGVKTFQSVNPSSGLTGYLGQDLETAMEQNQEFLDAAAAFQANGGILGPDALARVNEVRETNQAMREHLELMHDIASASKDLADGLKNAFAGGDELIGEDWLNAIGALQTGLEGVAEAAEANADAYGLVSAALPAMRGFTKEFVKDLKTRALLEMFMNAAAAWAAYPNVPKMVAHGTAAVIYGMVAGGAIKLPSKATKTEDKEDDGKKKDLAPINVYLYGEMIMSEGQLGMTVADGVQQARAEGRLD